MRYARIIGTGSYLPAKIVTNNELAKTIDTSDEWVVERTGIKQRHIANSDETSATLAELASKEALAAAGITANDIDLIVVATSTPDKIFPSTACILQQCLGVNTIPAFDVNAACAGFSYALSIADQFIRSQQAKQVLVVGSEVMSRIIDWQDRNTCVLFGDGAGAIVLTADSQPGILSTHLHADGSHGDLLYTPNTLENTRYAAEPPYMRMSGREVFKLAVESLGNIVDETLAANKLQKTDINWLIPHQANLRIIKAIAKKLAIPMERVAVTVDKHGNTSSASVPLTLDWVIRTGQVKPGDMILMESFGGGFAWGSALVKY